MTVARTERLILDYEYGAQSVFALKEAAKDLCDIIWLVDLRSTRMRELARLMARMGTVVDVADRSEAHIVEELRGLEPTGVLSLSDRSGMLVARLALALGLEFHSPLVAGRLFDKLLQREALLAAGIPGPAFAGVRAGAGPADIEAFATHVGFPAVVKPRQGSASRDAYRVRDRGELERLLAADGPFADETDGMILEAFLPASDHPVTRFAPIVSVESYFSDGEVRHFAVTGRLPFAEPFRETGSVLPSDLSPELARMAETTAASAIAAVGATYGCLHTEMKFTPDGPRIIEINGRIGGGIPEMMQLATGDVSILRLGITLALGVPCRVRPTFARIGWRRAITPPVSADRIEHITGLDKVKDIPGVDQVMVNGGAGDAVDWRQGYPGYVVQVYGSGLDYDEVEAQCAAVDAAVSVTYGDVVAAAVASGAGSGPDARPAAADYRPPPTDPGGIHT